MRREEKTLNFKRSWEAALPFGLVRPRPQVPGCPRSGHRQGNRVAGPRSPGPRRGDPDGSGSARRRFDGHWLRGRATAGGHGRSPGSDPESPGPPTGPTLSPKRKTCASLYTTGPRRPAPSEAPVATGPSGPRAGAQSKTSRWSQRRGREGGTPSWAHRRPLRGMEPFPHRRCDLTRDPLLSTRLVPGKFSFQSYYFLLIF